LVYLTTFSEQKALISVLLYYGFEKTRVNALGEEIYEKPLKAYASASGDAISGGTASQYEIEQISNIGRFGRLP
jgi:hypothetical protein